MCRTTLRLLVAVFLASLPSAAIAVPWHHPFYLDGGGWWSGRIRVVVQNNGQQPVNGEPLAVRIGDGPGEAVLANHRAEAIRVCSEQGQELLFAIRGPSGDAIASGPIPTGASLIVPVECGPKSSTACYVYFDNPNAAEVPDLLAGFQNPVNTQPKSSPLKATAGAPEAITLAETGDNAPWAGGPAQLCDHRAVVRAFNFSHQAASPAMILLDAAMFDARTIGGKANSLVMTDSGKPIDFCRIGDSLIWDACLPSMTAQTWQIYWSSLPGSAARSSAPNGSIGQRMVLSPLNEVKNPTLASGNPASDGWSHDDGAPDPGVEFSVDDPKNPAVGDRCLKMHVPKTAPVRWRGWCQTVRVEPGQTYLASAWVKCKDVAGTDVNVHFHRHTADGRPSADGLAVAIGPGLHGTTDWTLMPGWLVAPQDTHSMSICLTMNGTGTVWHGGVSLLKVTPAKLCRLECRPMQRGDEVKVWAEPAIAKVFADSPPPHNAGPMRITAARNEREPLQLAIRSGQAIPGVQVQVDAPVGPAGRRLDDLKINVVGFVPIDYPTNYYQSNSPPWHRKAPNKPASSDGWPGNWPDPLLPRSAFDLAANTTQPVWITVNVPKNASPGDYVGTVRLMAQGRQLTQQAFTVHVWNFTLPDEHHVGAKFEVWPGEGEQRWGRPWSEVAPHVFQLMAENRLCPGTVSPQPTFKYESAHVTADFAEFDRAAHRYFEELKFPFAWTPSCFYTSGWALPPPPFCGQQPYPGQPPFEGVDRSKLRPEYKQAYQACLKTFWEHVKAKGWDKKFVMYLCDEPFFTQPHIVQQVKALCQMIHEVDPQIPIYSSTWSHVPAWDDSLDIWGIGHYGIVPTEQIAKLKAAGKRVWWTTDGQMCTDTPYCAVERLLPHYCFKYGVEAYEFWGICWHTYDPYRRGWHAYIGQSDQPGVSYWIRYPNGDGFLLYPGKPIGVSGPVSSVRLEQAREGVEDFEYLYLLQQLIAKAKAAGNDITEAQKAMARAARLVTIPNAGGLRSSKILPDPTEVYVVKEQLGAAIESLTRGVVK
jgi:hypothetical protein